MDEFVICYGQPKYHRRCPGLHVPLFDHGKKSRSTVASHEPVRKHFMGVKVFEEKSKSSISTF